MAPEYVSSLSTELTLAQKNDWKDACWAVFADFMDTNGVEFFTLDDSEMKEVTSASNELAGLFGMKVPQEKWVTYAELGRYMISLKHVKNRRAALGAIIINSMTFFWDDVDDSNLHKQHLVLQKTHDICQRYYRKEHTEYVFSHIRQWVELDTFARRHPRLRENICLHHGVDTYWQFRLFDSGCPFWYGITGPSYECPEFLMASVLLAQVVLKPVMVVNDVYSYARESKVNENANFLNLTKNLNVAGKEAVMKQHLKAMRDDLQTLQEFSEPLREIMLNTAFGNLAGSALSIRYQD